MWFFDNTTFKYFLQKLKDLFQTKTDNNLDTTDKTIVGAINEINANSGSSGSSYTLPTASASTLGGIKVGDGLDIDGSGVLSATVITTTQIDTICDEILN